MNSIQSHTDLNPVFPEIVQIRQLANIGILACLALWVIAAPLAAQDLEQIGEQPPVRLTSGFSLQTSVYSVNNIPYRRQPFNWNLSGTPVLHLYGISMPFSFYVSNQQLGYQQPFNQVGLSPRYKWATAHLGYSSVRFSEYTLAGRRFLGGGVELNPGRLRFGMVYGRFQKAVEADTLVRSTPEGYLSGVPNAAFSRKGYAVKLGYGTQNNYLDLVFMQAADDTNSVAQSTTLESLTPEHNSVLGLRHRINIKSVFWESDAALSFYTRDIRAEEVDTTNVTPALRFLHELFDPKLSSQLLYAVTTQAGYSGQTFNTSVRYRRISQDFKTMGAYAMQTDLEEIAVQAGTSLLERRWQLRGNVGVQRNNLSETRLHTTRRLIVSLYSGMQLHQRLRVDATYSNFGITQTPLHPGQTDSVRIDQVNQSLQLSSSYQIPSADTWTQTLSVQFNLQDLSPRQSSSNVSEMNTINASAVYALSIPASQWSFSLSGNAIRNNTPAGTVQSMGGGATASKGGLWEGRVQARTGFRFFNTSFEQIDGGTTLTFDAGVNINITPRWSATAALTVTNSAGSGQHPGTSFTETLMTFGSQFNF